MADKDGLVSCEIVSQLTNRGHIRCARTSLPRSALLPVDVKLRVGRLLGLAQGRAGGSIGTGQAGIGSSFSNPSKAVAIFSESIRLLGRGKLRWSQIQNQGAVVPSSKQEAPAGLSANWTTVLMVIPVALTGQSIK